jgi:hypothetical protein
MIKDYIPEKRNRLKQAKKKDTSLLNVIIAENRDNRR